MATPPKPDPLSERREKDANDDFYDHPLCACEDEDPEPISEYDVPGEWVTYTGEINMEIFDQAAQTAKDELDKELKAYAALQQAHISGVPPMGAWATNSQSSSEPNSLVLSSSAPPSEHAVDDFAPSAPFLDEEDEDDLILMPAAEITHSDDEVPSPFEMAALYAQAHSAEDTIAKADLDDSGAGTDIAQPSIFFENTTEPAIANAGVEAEIVKENTEAPISGSGVEADIATQGCLEVSIAIEDTEASISASGVVADIATEACPEVSIAIENTEAPNSVTGVEANNAIDNGAGASTAVENEETSFVLPVVEANIALDSGAVLVASIAIENLIAEGGTEANIVEASSALEASAEYPIPVASIAETRTESPIAEGGAEANIDVAPIAVGTSADAQTDDAGRANAEDAQAQGASADNVANVEAIPMDQVAVSE